MKVLSTVEPHEITALAEEIADRCVLTLSDVVQVREYVASVVQGDDSVHVSRTLQLIETLVGNLAEIRYLRRKLQHGE